MTKKGLKGLAEKVKKIKKPAGAGFVSCKKGINTTPFLMRICNL